MDLVRLGVHKPDKTVHQIANVTERTGLRAVAVYGQFLAAKRLDHKIRYDAAVVLKHPFAKSVENTHDARINAVLTMIVHHQSFRHALALVVTASEPDRIYVAKIIFGLRVHHRVAVDLTRRRLENSGLHTFCKPQHVDRAHHVRFNRLYRVVLVMDRRRRAGEIIYLIHLEQYRLGNIVPDKLEVLVIQEMNDVLLPPGEKIVQADDLGAVGQEPFAKVRADETGAAGHENSHRKFLPQRHRGTEWE